MSALHGRSSLSSDFNEKAYKVFGDAQRGPSKFDKANKLLGVGVENTPRGERARMAIPIANESLKQTSSGFSRVTYGILTLFKGSSSTKSNGESSKAPGDDKSLDQPGFLQRMKQTLRRGSVSRDPTLIPERDPTLIPEKDAEDLKKELGNEVIKNVNVIGILRRSDQGKELLKGICTIRYQSESFKFMETFDAFKKATTSIERHSLYQQLQELCKKDTFVPGQIENSRNAPVRLNEGVVIETGNTSMGTGEGTREILLKPVRQSQFKEEGSFNFYVQLFNEVDNSVVRSVAKDVRTADIQGLTKTYCEPEVPVENEPKIDKPLI